MEVDAVTILGKGQSLGRTEHDIKLAVVVALIASDANSQVQLKWLIFNIYSSYYTTCPIPVALGMGRGGQG